VSTKSSPHPPPWTRKLSCQLLESGMALATGDAASTCRGAAVFQLASRRMRHLSGWCDRRPPLILGTSTRVALTHIKSSFPGRFKKSLGKTFRRRGLSYRGVRKLGAEEFATRPNCCQIPFPTDRVAGFPSPMAVVKLCGFPVSISV
jgi:hypothetical protein